MSLVPSLGKTSGNSTFTFPCKIPSVHHSVPGGNDEALNSEVSLLKQNHAVYPDCSLAGLGHESIWEDRDVRIGYLRLVAVSRGHHPLGIDEGTTTEVIARVQGHLVGDGILLTGVAPNDLVIIIDGESNWQGKVGNNRLNRSILEFLFTTKFLQIS